MLQGTLPGVTRVCMWPVLKKILGILCILLGLAALVTPLTPGSWLTLVGLELLGFGFLIPKVLREKLKKFMNQMKQKVRKT